MKSRQMFLMALAMPLIYQPLQAENLVHPEATAEQSVLNEEQQDVVSLKSASMLNPTTAEFIFSNQTYLYADFYGENIFRLFKDDSGKIIRDPQAKPEAQILVDSPRKAVGEVKLKENENEISLTTAKIKLVFNKANSLFQLIRLSDGKVVTESVAPIKSTNLLTQLRLKEATNEYFYGGGVQNGRFSHKGKIIAIENTNNWTDGGVASPTPFYWSTAGYGVFWHTFKMGKYDFGATEKNTVILNHDENYLDVFFMVNETPVALLNDFYQLTGNPVLLPKFGFYEGHLNAYNRDYWKEDPNGILFEDGKKYKESQKDNGGIRESLNGEKNNYQFSGRAVIDRYAAYDMPLGWLLPNDGYGAGYGQTETLNGNIQNLKELGNYARTKGVEIGLWTQSDLHPKEGVSALLQRDIVKEVRDAGVRVLKTDVAWVGAGYSFGLNGVADVGHIMPYYGNNARPFIISLDGWAGTQRYAGIWSGDQTGGNWEYIRFHIPTYIGSGLSGQPNICSDMDGIFGGKNIPVNVRDFQWKTFTPMQLNMDGWGANPKYPQALGEPATSINRWYLKMKSEFMPYTYSIAKEAVDGKPMIRAMFLDEVNPYTLGTATRYQYLYGPYILVAPIYQATQIDEEGNDIRDGIYLPEGNWVDYFTGNVYAGGQILNNYETPLWKLPFFIKQGAILPMTEAHNNVNEMQQDVRIYEVYPYGHSDFTEYDDDGITENYRLGAGSTTLITQNVEGDVANIRIFPTKGNFKEMIAEKATEIRINVTKQPKKVIATVNGKKVKLTAVTSLADLKKGENVFFYEATPELNRFATPNTKMASLKVTKNPLLHVRLAKTDITKNEMAVQVKGFEFAPANKLLKQTTALTAPKVQVNEKDITAYTLTPSWDKVEGADYYEIEYDGMLYSTIKNQHLQIGDLTPETKYELKVRAVNKAGVSDWTTLNTQTQSDPLEFAIHDLKATTTCEDQPGERIAKLFDWDESNIWHTKWGVKATPFDMIIDLRSVNQLDKFQYLPRTGGGNGTILNGTVAYSLDKTNWTEAGQFEWKGDAVKTFQFKEQPTARYVKLTVTKAVGNFGSGRELYVFRVAGSEYFIPGDINQDKRIDENDLTSYMNYTGLRKGDGDFEGYISKGDLNANGLIDAFDISSVAIELEDGVWDTKIDSLAGQVSITADKKAYKAGEEITISVKGKGLSSVNAISFAIPYEQPDMEYVGVDAKGMKEMKNLTYDRLHTNGQKALYPTFVNIGEKPYLKGDGEIMVLRFKAKRNFKLNLQTIDGMLVDKNMNTIKF